MNSTKKRRIYAFIDSKNLNLGVRNNVIKKGKIIIFPMYHPSYITNYSGYKEKDYEKDFKRLGELI